MPQNVTCKSRFLHIVPFIVYSVSVLSLLLILSSKEKMSLGQQLKMCNESHFFKVLEECVQCRIPSQLKKILTLHSYNSAISLSGGLCKIIESIESFMRHQFTQSIIMDDESSVDYLGIWVNDQKKFQLMSGQKRMLEVFVQYCSELYQGNYEMYDTPRPDPSEINTTNALSDYIPSPDEQEGLFVLRFFKRIQVRRLMF